MTKRISYKTVFLLSITVLCIIGLFITYGVYVTNRQPIRSDGYGYYIYLPAAFIYRDLTFQTIVDVFFQDTAPMPHGAFRYYAETDSYWTKYPAGTAVLQAPFFFLGWLGAAVTGFPQDGFSTPFQYAIAFSGAFYGLAGLAILWRFLAKEFSQSTILFCMSIMLFGTNLFHYMTYKSIFSHIYSFFLFSLFLYLISEYLYKRDSRWWTWCLMGSVAGLIVITRPTNIVWILLGILYGIGSDASVRQRVLFWRDHFGRGVVIVLSSFAILFIQMAYWYAVTGQFIFYSYGGEGLNFANPEIRNVLFSIRRGVFLWMPIWLMVFPGLFFIRRRLPSLFLPILIFLPLNLYIISSWSTLVLWCIFLDSAVC